MVKVWWLSLSRPFPSLSLLHKNLLSPISPKTQNALKPGEQIARSSAQRHYLNCLLEVASYSGLSSGALTLLRTTAASKLAHAQLAGSVS